MSSSPPQRPSRVAQEALIATLNELLEAERAGARVALQTLKEAPATLLSLMRTIQHDEARWCALLVQAIQHLGGKPSRRTGSFYAKAMAIEDLPARLVFLNHGQRWVLRRLRAILPQVDDPHLQAGLQAMRTAHEDNVERLAARIDAQNAD
jgi:nitronate monooxygenase